MAIQPIDLQTLFVRLSQVGREQSALKQAVAQNQAVVGSELAKESREAESAVRQSDEVSEGPETVDDEGHANPQPRGEAERERGDESQDDESAEDDVFHDPALGQNIDLTG